MDQVSTGQRVKVLRTKAGLSVEDLAQLVGLSPHTIYRIEGATPAPRTPLTSTLIALATALGSRVGWLATGEGLEPSIEDVLAAVAKARQAKASEHGRQADGRVG